MTARDPLAITHFLHRANGEVVGPFESASEMLAWDHEAADYAASLSDALKAQAEKSAIEPKALRMYIAALCSDKRAEAKKVADDLALLLGEAGD